MKVTQLSPLTDEINQLRLKAQKLEYADRVCCVFELV
jgi:hypothetical protein